ncbi:NAD-dependent epimerase/dehydratase family protein [Rhizobacter sp. P5_C2]
MKIALTGATGFVGRHTVQALARCSDVEVVATARSAERPAHLPSHVRYVALDLATTGLNAFELLGRPDTLVHLAWSGLPNYRSLHHFESELPRQYSFLRTMLDAGLGSLLVTGTCYEYGMSSGELAESVVAPPANPYAHAKGVLHQQLEFLRASQPFALTWARLFYMHGEGQFATSLVPQLAAAVARGDVSFPMSRGEQLRDYLPVETVASCLAELAVRCPGAGTINVCSGQPISVRAFVEQLLERNGWRIALDLGKYPVPDYEPLAFWGCSRRLHELLGTTTAEV